MDVIVDDIVDIDLHNDALVVTIIQYVACGLYIVI